jgi:hypothetical protein
MEPENKINEDKSEGKSVVFSEDEIDIINKVVNTIHNDKNSIYLNINNYCAFVVIDDLKDEMLKELKNNHNIDSNIIKSFRENNAKEDFIKGKKIDNANNFNFLFEWYDWYEHRWGEYLYKDKKILIKNYEIITISGIGFNEDQTKAIILVRIEYEYDGNGKIYVLEKSINKWEIVEIIDIFGIEKNANNFYSGIS